MSRDPRLDEMDGDDQEAAMQALVAAIGNGPGDEPRGERNADNHGSPGVPMETARCAVRSLFQVENRKTGISTTKLVRWRGEWWRWTGTYWTTVSEEVLRSALYHWLEHAVYKAPKMVKGAVVGYEDKMWNPNRGKIADVSSALGAVVQQPDELEQETWRDGRDAVRLVACQNTLVDPLTGACKPHDVMYFNGSILGFNYDADAVCPTWLGFLESLWPGDEESKRLLQEWMGYVLSGRTDLQKFMYFKGLSRSGKGTIIRIIRLLLGERNTTGADFEALGSSGFGMETMVGKTLATSGDVRYSGDKKTTQTAISKILSVTGEDEIQVNRKYKPVWTGILPTRLMLLSNEMPWFRDSSSAITNRMLLLVFKESFLGREDHTLEIRLAQELAGIFVWAMEGYRELVIAGGVFTRPAASADVLEEFRESVSPIETWLTTCCEQIENSPDALISSGALYAEWCKWCDVNGHKYGGPNGFLRLVQTVWPKVSRHPVAVKRDGKVFKAWRGIRYVGPLE